MKKFYVWSGSLKGVEVAAETPAKAVVRAVQENLPCMLSNTIRVSRVNTGQHPLDVHFHPPYEESFPELFEGELEVQIERGNER